jgi:hypothetical protein
VATTASSRSSCAHAPGTVGEGSRRMHQVQWAREAGACSAEGKAKQLPLHSPTLPGPLPPLLPPLLPVPSFQGQRAAHLACAEARGQLHEQHLQCGDDGRPAHGQHLWQAHHHACSVRGLWGAAELQHNPPQRTSPSSRQLSHPASSAWREISNMFWQCLCMQAALSR